MSGMYSKQPTALDSVGVCSMLWPGMAILFVRELFLVILLLDTGMISNFTLKRLRKSFNSLMWKGRDDIFRWITDRSVSLIFSLVIPFIS